MNTCFVFIYQLAIRLYGLAIRIAAWFQPKAKQWVEGRKDIFIRLEKAFREETATIIWIHCASLGEFEQGRPLIEKLKAKHPSYKIILTFYSPSGYEIRKNYALADYVFYLPLDTPVNAQRFISIVQPKMVFFVKYEFWYFYLITLKEQKIPYYLIAGVFRRNQLFFKSYGKWYLEAIKGFEQLFLIDQASVAIVNRHGLRQVQLTGDPRIDRVATIAQNAPRIEVITDFKGEKKLFILGSAHEKDWRIFFSFITIIQNKNYFENWRFMIAPHEISADQLIKIEHQAPLPITRYTNWSNHNKLPSNSLLLLDTIGQLSAAYQYGDIAFIGGGFDKSIHNILEPAAFGLPILFGPNYQKFQEAKDLIEQGGAVSIRAEQDLVSVFNNWLEKVEVAVDGEVAKSYIKKNMGGTERIMEALGL